MRQQVIYSALIMAVAPVAAINAAQYKMTTPTVVAAGASFTFDTGSKLIGNINTQYTFEVTVGNDGASFTVQGKAGANIKDITGGTKTGDAGTYTFQLKGPDGGTYKEWWETMQWYNQLSQHIMGIVITNTGNAPLNITSVVLKSEESLLNQTVNSVKEKFNTYQTVNIKDYTTVSAENNARLQLLIDICNKKTEEWTIENFSRFSMYAGAAGLTAEFNSVKAEIEAAEAAKYLKASGYNEMTDKEKEALSDNTKAAIEAAKNADADHKVAATQYAAFLVKCDKVQAQITRYEEDLLDQYKASVDPEKNKVNEETGEGGAKLGTYQENAFRTSKKRLEGFKLTLAEFKKLGKYENETTFTEPTNVEVEGCNKYADIDALLGKSDAVKKTSGTGILENIGYVQYCAGQYQEKFDVVFNQLKGMLVSADDNKDAIDKKVADLKKANEKADYSELAEEYKKQVTDGNNSGAMAKLDEWKAIKEKGEPISYVSGHSGEGWGSSKLNDPEAPEWAGAKKTQYVPWQKWQKDLYDLKASGDKNVKAMQDALQAASDEYTRETEYTTGLTNTITDIESGLAQLDDAAKAKTIFNDRIAAIKTSISNLSAAVELANSEVVDNELYFDHYTVLWGQLKTADNNALENGDYIEVRFDAGGKETVINTFEYTGQTEPLEFELPRSSNYKFYVIDKSLVQAGADDADAQADRTHEIDTNFREPLNSKLSKVSPTTKNLTSAWTNGNESFYTQYEDIVTNIKQLSADILESVTEYNAYNDVADQVYKMEGEGDAAVPADGTLLKRYEKAKADLDKLTETLKTLRDDDAADKVYKDSEFLNDIANQIEGYIRAVKSEIETAYGLGTDKEGQRKWDDGTDPNGDNKGNATQWWLNGNATHQMAWQADNMKARVEISAPSVKTPNSVTSKWGIAVRFGEKEQGNQIFMPKGTYTFTFGLKQEIADRAMSLQIHNGMEIGSKDDPLPNGTQIAAVSSTDAANWKVVNGEDGMKLVTATITLADAIDKGGIIIAEAAPHGKDNGFTISNLTYTVDASDLWQAKELTPIDKQGNAITTLSDTKWTDVDGLLKKMESDTEIAQTAIQKYIDARTVYQQDANAIQNVLDAVKNHGVYTDTDKASTRTYAGDYNAADGYIAQLNKLLKERTDAFTAIETPGALIDYSASEKGKNYDEIHWEGINYNLKTDRMYVNKDLNAVYDGVPSGSDADDYKLIEEWFTADKIAADKAAYDFSVQVEGVETLYKQIYGTDGHATSKKDGLVDAALDKWKADKALTYDALVSGVAPKKVFGLKAASILDLWNLVKTNITNTAKKNDMSVDGAYKLWYDYKNPATPYANLTAQSNALSDTRDKLLKLKDQLDAFNYNSYKVDGQDYTNGELDKDHINDVQFDQNTNLELLKKYTVDIANAFSDNQALYDSLTIDVPQGQRGAFLVVIDEAKAAKANVTTEIFPGLDKAEIDLIKDYYQDIIDELSLGGGLRDDVENGYKAETLRGDFHADKGIQQEFAFLKERLYLIGKYCQLRSDANLALDAFDAAHYAIENNPEKYGKWDDNDKGPDVFDNNLFEMGGSAWKDASTDHDTKLTQRFVGWEIIDGEGYLETDGTNAINFHDIVDGSTDFSNYCTEDAKYAEHLNEYGAEGKVKETAFRTDADQYLERFAELISVLGTSATTITDPNMGPVAVDDISAPEKFQVEVKNAQGQVEKTVIPHDMIARQLKAAELNKTAYDELTEANEKFKTRVATILGYLDNPAMHQATEEGTILKDIINTYYKPVYAKMQTLIDEAYNTGKAYWQSSVQTKLDPVAAYNKAEMGDWSFEKDEQTGEKSIKLDKNAQAKTTSNPDQLFYYVITDSLASLNKLYETFAGNYSDYLIEKNADIFSDVVQKAYDNAFVTQRETVLAIEKFKTPKDPALLKAFNDAFKRATETIYKAPDALRKALALAKQNKLDADNANATYAPTTAEYEEAVALFEEFESFDNTEYPYTSTKYTDVALIQAIENMISHEFGTFVGSMKTALELRGAEVLTGAVNMQGTINDAWDDIKGFYAKAENPRVKFSDVYPTDGTVEDWFYEAKKAAAQLWAYGVQIGKTEWKDYDQYLEADAILMSKVVTDFDGYMKERLNAAASLDLENRIEIAFTEKVLPDAQSVEGGLITRTITIGEGDDVQTKTVTAGDPKDAQDKEGNELDFTKHYDTQYKGFGPADAKGNYWSFKYALAVVNKDKEGDPYKILTDEFDKLVYETVGAAELWRIKYDADLIAYDKRNEVLNLFRLYTQHPEKFQDIYDKFMKGFDYTDPETGNVTHYDGYNQFLADNNYAYAVEDLGNRIDDEIAGISSLYVGSEPARQDELADIKKEFEEEKAAPGTHDIYDLTKRLDDQIEDAKADDYAAMLEELTKLKNEYNLMIANAATQEEKDALTDKYANAADETLNIEKNIERIKELQKKLDADMDGVLDNPRDLSDDGTYEDYVKVESNVSKIKAEIAGKKAEDLAAICDDLLENKVKPLLDTESKYTDAVGTGFKVLAPENPALDDYKYTDFGLHKNYLDVVYQAELKKIAGYTNGIAKIKETIEAHKTAGDILLFQENIEKQIAEFTYGEGGKYDLADVDYDMNSNEDDGFTSDYELNQKIIAVAENQATQKARLQAEIDAVKALIDPAVATINAQQAKYIDGDGNEQTLVADMTAVEAEIAKIQQRLNVYYLTRDKAIAASVTLKAAKGAGKYTIGMHDTHPELVTEEWLEKWQLNGEGVYNAETGVAKVPATVGLDKVQQWIEDMVEKAIDMRAQNKYDEASEAYYTAGGQLNATTMRADQKDALLVKFRGQDPWVAVEGTEDDSFQARLYAFYSTKDDRTAETIDQYAADIDQFIKDLLGEPNAEGEYEGGFLDEIDDTKAGDSNGDGNVNALDLAYLLLRVNNPTYINSVDGADDYARCDLNNDGYIDVVDLGIMTDILAGGTADDYLYKEGVLSARAAKAAGEHLVATVAAQQGNSHRIAISLQNVRDYTAFQMDITLPEGMRLAGQSLTDRANGQELYANEWDGKVRIVAFTAAKSAFTANDGDLLYLDVETTDDYKGDNVRFDNVLFLTTDSKGQRFQMEGAVATGIMDRMADAVDGAKEKIYNLGGRLMDGLKKGVNIIRGDKKVIKK